MRYVLQLAYHGGSWHGWQRQPAADSVQGQLERALGILLRTPTAVVGAGRTDAGVHAEAQYAHFDSEVPWGRVELDKLNGILPHSIGAVALYRAADEFHARFDALSRSYRYQIALGKAPLDMGLTHRLEARLDFDALAQATALLFQTEDFASFCKAGADNATTLCTLSEARWEAYDARGLARLDFHVTANRFLRGMVRALVGTLLDVARGKLTVAEFEAIIRARDRSAAGVAAPAEGLYLSAVAYPEGTLTKIVPEV